ncbi:mucin-2 [Musca domestica]|uniref:Mucin-2 n=1 Tax=Musca domestica TaxID=7370 RepID=A0A9J7CMV5_MUSDO|nr:mucin-2 [Musca domestica]
MFRIAIFCVLSFAILQNTEAVCGVCNQNGAACISENEFHMCFEGKPDTSKTYKCPNSGDLCTRFSQICVDRKEAPNATPACGDTSNCGKCETVLDGSFTCTSRTTYTMCKGYKLSGLRFKCPEYYMCDVALASEGQNPCVPDCKESSITFCDLTKAIDEPETTTTEGYTTTTPMEPTTTPEEQTTTTEPNTTEPVPSIPTTTTDIPTTVPVTSESTPTTIPTTQPPTTTSTTEVPTTQPPTTTTEIPTTQPPPTTTTTTETPTTQPPPTTTTTEIPTTQPPPTTTTTQIPTTQPPPTTTTVYAPTPTTTPEPTTTELPTTTTTTENPADVLCSQQTAVGRYPHPTDNTCRKYINCYLRDGVMKSTTMSCPGQLYFDAATTLCAENKPEGCV